MKVTKFTSYELIKPNLAGNTKKEVLKELVELLEKNNKIDSYDRFYQAIIERENEESTGLGRGIAIPHGRNDTVRELSFAAGISRKGIDFNSLDGKSVNLFFMIADIPNDSNNYLKLLSRLTYGLRQDELRKELLTVNKVSEVLEVLNKF